MKHYFFMLLCAALSVGCAAKAGNSAVYTAQNQKEYAGQEVIFVYDAADTLLFTFTDAQHRDKLGTLIGEGTAQTGSENPAALFTKVPADAQILYRYVLQNDRGSHVELLVYANYRSVEMRGLPVLGSITWEIPEADYNTLCRPDIW